MIVSIVIVLLSINNAVSILYPTDSETRTVKDLSGRWKFRIDDSPSRDLGFVERWWNNSLGGNMSKIIDMPVPASYNDITQDKSIRNFVGWAWYQTEFFVPSSWQKDSLVWLRIGSAHYYARVWINSVWVMDHEGGHLPFETEVSKHLHFGNKNQVTIAVNNTLTTHTLPSGRFHHKGVEYNYPAGYFVQSYEFDFFNYAGIHRPVKLYTTPVSYIKEVAMISTLCDFSFRKCDLKYSVQIGSSLIQEDLSLTVSLLDAEMRPVASNQENAGYLTVEHANLWWPIGMNESVAYLYTLLIELNGPNGNLVDIYRLKVGIRTVEVKGKKFLINGKPFYFLGVGRHEDWVTRGKGFDWASILKDFSLMEWVGANSFRTTHYPYAEEIMQICNERGFVIVDECPATGMILPDNFVNKTLVHHLKVIDELIARDRNHPSVVMWSVANEPNASLEVSVPYFSAVVQHTKQTDPSRPVTFVSNQWAVPDLATSFTDVISVNKYSSWYEDCGHIEVIRTKVPHFLRFWFEERGKPIIVMEWGAAVVAGMHSSPSVMFTEEFLEDVMVEYFKVFDALRADFLVGEMIWTLADYDTQQSLTRVAGNKKGLFTRERHPKSAAFMIRRRYHSLRNQTITL